MTSVAHTLCVCRMLILTCGGLKRIRRLVLVMALDPRPLDLQSLAAWRVKWPGNGGPTGHPMSCLRRRRLWLYLRDRERQLLRGAGVRGQADLAGHAVWDRPECLGVWAYLRWSLAGARGDGEPDLCFGQQCGADRWRWWRAGQAQCPKERCRGPGK